jgi:hypothetical protein
MHCMDVEVSVYISSWFMFMPQGEEEEEEEED